ncbi:hypothetical protein GCM10010960_09990 [Arenimonas maotaiensis]|uniref:Tetratricopeptide repeat protein n=1 Tax=Arenimonas maotaiensis TaxID=1446479 RepID=A0A917FMN4_9GAMM|nr:hypothetical protein [Arenimonas maotaiensis]GGF90145.1 hypothetical protein GCM10010960_09990 [Arenimonas maotaiensis]
MILTRKHALIPSATLLLLLVVYAGLGWPALSGPFVFDDFPNLQNLELLSGNAGDNLGRYLTSFIGSPGRPISALSFLINDSAWPSDPFSFKYTNLMIHLLNGVLLFGLLRQLAKANPSLPQSPFWPLLAMAAWLFHPLQLSAQMLVVQRMTLLSAAFCFIGLWGYIALLQRAKSVLSAFAALSVLGICTILASLSKENGALLPLFALVLNATLLRETLAGKPLAIRRFIQWACILPSLAVFAAILYMATRPGTFSSRDFNMPERLMTQMHVLADYLRHIFMPRLSGSGIYFDDYPVTRSWTQPVSTLLLAIGFAASLLFAIAKRKRFPILSFAILWFFAGHAMESSILDLELFFEHRNYLPLLGPVLALSALPFLLGERQRLATALFSLWLALLAIITALQAPVWGNAELMTALWVKERPLSLRAAQDVAKYRYDSGQPQEALDGLMQAYDGGIRQADLPMAALLVKCWNPTVQTSRDLYQDSTQAIGVSSYSNSVLSSLLLLRQAVQENACPDAIDQTQWLTLTDALLANPKFRAVSEQHIRVERAKLFIHRRDLDLTMTELERAYTVGPSVELTQKIAEVLLSAGLVDDAEQWLKKGLEIKQPFFDTLMYDPKDQSRKWLKAIEIAKMSQSQIAPPPE